MNPEMQVSATESALALIELIKSRHGDDLLFHQSGGCWMDQPQCASRNLSI